MYRNYSLLGATCDETDQLMSFSPDAPTHTTAPVAPRATPYTSPPTECFLSLTSGIVTCIDNSSAGGLPAPTIPYTQSASRQHQRQHPFSQFTGTRDRNSPLSPLNRILQREPVGAWETVGYISTGDPAMAQSRDRTMLLYAQSIDTRRNRYNYRAVDSNGVPIELGEKVEWLMDEATVTVPSQSVPYTVHIYRRYR